MRIAFVVNAIRTQSPAYTSAHLALEAHRRGHDARYVSVSSFSFGDDNRVTADAVKPAEAAYADTAEYVRALQDESSAVREEVCLNEFDVVFLRNNPQERTAQDGPARNPGIDFGRRLKRNKVLVVNDPEGLVYAGTRMYLAEFPEAIRPRTLIARSVQAIKEFLKTAKSGAVLKPFSGRVGEDIFFIRRGQVANLNQMIEAVVKDGYAIAQEYIREAQRGDKRILLLHGDPLTRAGKVACFRRLRGEVKGERQVRPCGLTASDRRICDILRPRLLDDGIYFCAVDVAGKKVIDVNVLSPGGLHEADGLYGIRFEESVIDDLERKVEIRRAYFNTIDPSVLLKS